MIKVLYKVWRNWSTEFLKLLILADFDNFVEKKLITDSACYLKEIAVKIVVPLTYLYNKSLQQGIVPQAWKQSHIAPVHKGCSLGESSNFRQISLVPVVAKILEINVSTQLSSYLENHSLLHHHQGPYSMAKLLKTSCWLRLILFC